MRCWLTALIVGICAGTVWAGGLQTATLNAVLAPQPLTAARRLAFVENDGQYSSAVRFRTATSIHVATITDEGLVLTLVASLRPASGRAVAGHNILFRFAGPSDSPARVHARGFAGASTRCSYFLGNDASRWVAGVPCWSAVRFDDVAPGVSVEVHGENGLPEYDFIVAPGASSDSLRVLVEGADRLVPHDDGSLDIVTPLGTVHQAPPCTWEVGADGNRHFLDSRLDQVGCDQFTFAVVGRDPSRTLVVDPGLAYSTFIDGSGYEVGRAIAVDDAGAAYVAGESSSVNFPVTPGAFQIAKTPNDPVGEDLVVVKLNPDGSALEYATWLGGHVDEHAYAIAIDHDGNAYLVGGTGSWDFPTTAGALSQSLKGLSDGFVTKLNPTGTALIYSTFFGGTGQGVVGSDWCGDLVVDSLGRAVIGGATGSPDLPVTPNCPQGQLPVPSAGYISRLTVDGSAVDFCTYVGCQGSTGGVNAVAIDSTGSIYGAGLAVPSDGLPVTAGAFQTTFPNNFGDDFVLKIAPNGTLAWCTLLGGIDDERVAGLRVDAIGQPIVAGYTSSYDFPSTANSFDPTINGGFGDGYVVKFSADGSSLVWATFLGGGDGDGVADLDIDASGNCYVAMGTGSTNMPVTPDAFDPTLNTPGLGDAYVGKISADGSQLLYGSYIGSSGNNVDGIYGIAVDPSGDPYIAGVTSGADFPTTPGSLGSVMTGADTMFVTKFDLPPWFELSHALAGAGGIKPRLQGVGTLQPLSPGSLKLTDAHPLAPCWLILGLSAIDAPTKGGMLVPSPDVLIPAATDAQGKLTLPWTTWPAGVPLNTKVWFQCWIADPQAIDGYAVSDAIEGVTQPGEGQ